ncbi:hypothetical protein [Amaricoccus macauensis]|uniref:hypothetical protein n=1 Tax=Amaricoccus macauensis TaxID=57001 RepID=UPI003C7A4180
MTPRRPSRRSFIGLAVAAAAFAPFIGRFIPPARAAVPAVAPGFHVVDGWILTDADVAALRDHGVRAENA